MTTNNVVVVSASNHGHRKHWLDVCSGLVSVDLISDIRILTLLKCLRYQKVFFLAIDDHYLSGLCLAAFRWGLGKKTSALILAPQFVVYAKTTRQALRSAILQLSAKLNIIELYTCGLGVGELDCEWAGGLADLNLIDLSVLPVTSCCPPELSAFPASKRLIASVGVQRHEKMPELFMRCYIGSASLRKDSVFGIFGRQHAIDQQVVREFRAAGGLVIDRYLSDEELIWIEKKSVLLWTLYEDTYDQSSGVFGHAVQLEMPCLVRQGSRLEEAQRRLGYKLMAELNLDSVFHAVEAFLNDPSQFQPISQIGDRQNLSEQWRVALTA